MAKLFSIKEKYSNKIYSKEKLVEFRRQNVNINKGEFCLIYTTSPVKKITGYFIVKEKIRTTIRRLWQITKEFAGISYTEFKEYFNGRKVGTAILFKRTKKFDKSVTLEDLRKECNFIPPQSYYNLTDLLVKLFADVIPPP
ncbi:MAG: hypothetical protein KAQ83_02920 [Nanoarchaeota archaeon]|nr:hypothetical protein [Nanoarchaeota archaeon]